MFKDLHFKNFFGFRLVMAMLVIACVIVIVIELIVINMMKTPRIRHKMSAILVDHNKETSFRH